jgi:hypothetical protein
MGADSTIIFYGLRFATDDSESGSLQTRTDPRIIRAREHQLAHWWGSFSLDDVNEQSYLFVGSLIGHIGHEGKYELCLSDDELSALIESTKSKLREAGFADESRLYIQFEPDY